MRLLRSCFFAVLTLSTLTFGAHAAEPEKSKLSIAVGSQILNYMPLALANSLGNFKQEGLDVTIENFQAGGSKALQALIGGSVDATVGFYDHTIQMQAQGKEISCVFLLNDIPAIVMGVRADLGDKIKSVADLKGLKIGITAPGSSTDMIARYLVKKAGLGPRDVNIIAVGSGAPGMTALESKNVDALMYFDPVATLMARKGTAKILYDARNVEGSKAMFGGVYPTACLYSTKAFIEKNPETVQRMANGLLRTMRFIAASTPEQLVDAIPAGYKIDDRALNIEIIKASSSLFSKTGLFDAKSAETPLAVLSDFDPKIAAAKIDLSRTFTNRFAEEAARRVK
jgi:NitT/TauT family transport system substrate-binding protein